MPPRGPFGHIGPHKGGRSLNAYERARPDPTSRNLFESLDKGSAETLSKPPLDVRTPGEDLQPKNLTYLGSYNWIEATVPSIIVPGSPRKWVDKPFPLSVPLDHGYNFVDQNGHRMGSRSLLPLIRAVQDVESQPGTKKAEGKFDWSSVDFVTDRNGLRKLLRWIVATPGDPPRDFRIDMQLAGSKTVLMSRWEQFTKEQHGTRCSYGFNFEEAMTDPGPGCDNGTGHHRIVTYDFDGLKMVVRFEVDACLPLPSQDFNPKTIREPIVDNGDDKEDAWRPSRESDLKAIEEPLVNSGNGDGPEAALLGALSGLSIGTSPRSIKKSSQPPLTSTDLKILRAGTQVPQSNLIEMTTRSEISAKNFDWGDAYPQLYLSQTPNHYLAVHRTGTFFKITKRKIGTDDMVSIENKQQPSFKKLRKMLGEIQTRVKEGGANGRITLVCKGGILKVYERISKESCLPEDSLALFEQK